MRTASASADRPLPGTTLAWLLGALLLALIPHLTRLPLWISAMTLGLGGLRWLLQRRQAALPPRWLLLLVALAGAAGVFVYYGTLLGKNAGVALLCLMLACKLLEMARLRDTMLVIFLGYFLVITHLLYSQDLLLAVYLGLVVWVLTATLLELTHPGDAPRTTLRLAARLLVHALPIMAVLFLLFPRLSGPLWSLPRDAARATTGLSDRMQPGAISELSQSNAVAFRVEFSGAVPAPAQRYWRGPVFWYTDGHTWSGHPPGVSPAADGALPYRALGQAVDYAVTLEPHGQRWLFALDLPASVQTSATVTRDFQVLAPTPVKEVRRYSARSYPDYRTDDAAPREQRHALQLPRRVSPRVAALAAQWRSTAADPGQIVNAALRYFREQPFVYTLNPPLLGNDPVDEFLFDTRRGFCEHYAAAFTLLMRLAGIPARVVTGYQGGEFNPLGDYLIVRQSDAHAWSEVLLPGRGWVRIDPTAAVAPERVERSIQPALDAVGEPVRFRLQAPDLLARWARDLRYAWDGLQNGWNQWVLGYGPELQRRFLAALGLGEIGWRGMGLLLVGVISLLLGAVTYLLLRQERARRDPVVESYRRFCRRLARRGLARRAHEGPYDYAARVTHARPELREPVQRITRLYVALRYGASRPPLLMGTLQRQVRAFRP